MECLNNLKQLGLFVLLYADGQNSRIRISSPLDTQFTWGGLLYSNQLAGTRAIFVCPAYPPRECTNWLTTFGVWSDPPETVTAGEFREDVVTTAIPNPAEYVHLADTTSRGRRGLGKVQFHTFRTNAAEEVHARHTRTANGWLFDGHAEAMTRSRMENLNIRPLFGPDTIPDILHEGDSEEPPGGSEASTGSMRHVYLNLPTFLCVLLPYFWSSGPP